MVHNTHSAQENERFNRCLAIGNRLMIVSGLLFMASVMMSFGFEQHFSIPVLVMAHMVTIVFAALFKVGYVIRCVGAHELGHRAY